MSNTIIETLCGNHKVYTKIYNWLQEISNRKCAFIVGDSCIGKTYSINKLCNHLGLYITYIDSINCFDSSSFKDLIFKASTSSLVQSIEHTNKNKIILIDNFDALYYTDKSVKASLLKIIASSINVHIICITNQDVFKKMGDVKKYSEVFELSYPTEAEITLLLKQMKIKLPKIKQLIKNADGNIARIFELIATNSTLNYSYSDPRYDIMYLYSTNTYDRNIITNIVIPDPWQVPLRFHENLITEMLNRNIKQEQFNKVYTDFIKHLCQYDLFMYKNNPEIAVEFFSSIIYPIIHVKAKKKIVVLNKFTKILSYLSLQKKYNKNLYASDFPFYQIGNYHTTLSDRKFICFN